MNAQHVLEIQALNINLANGPNARPLVRNLSLSIDAGETLSVVGESGSGKSLTSLAIMGLLSPRELKITSGKIVLNGEPIHHATSSRLRSLRATSMAMIFQEPMTALSPSMTVGAQIDEVLRTHTALGAGERKRRILDMLEQVHMTDSERIYASYPHRLSGGQRQRIMIAMALVMKPKLLIADEPTTALDVSTQSQILKLIRELQEKQGTAVMFITHDMGVVAEIATNVVVLRAGEIVETGTRDTVLRRPKSDYTSNLLKAVPSLIPRPPRPQVSSPAVLDVDTLSKVYVERRLFRRARELASVRDVSFSVLPGRTLGIVGESGSGKSTVARSLIGLATPDGGRIAVGGDIAEVDWASRVYALRKKVQIVFQDPYRSLNPRRRVGNSIIEGAINFGMSREQAWERAAELLRLVGLSRDALVRFPHQFSGGQRQRIAIARALMLEPSVLIADEAVSALDVSVQAQTLDLLDRIQQQLSLGIVFITHDLRVAAQICDDILVMQRGRIVEFGPTEEVMTKPRADYTRMLIEATPGREWDFRNHSLDTSH